MKRNIIRRCVTTALTVALAASTAFAASPKFSFKLNGAIGGYNLGRNTYVNEVPGIADNLDLDLDFSMKGSFSKEGNIKSASYYSGAYLDVDKLYRNYSSSRGSSDKYGNSFSKLQGMIDWYETNWHRYGLEAPNWKLMDKSEKFIKGSTVVNPEDITWNDATWDAAKKLSEAVEDVITQRISNMFVDKGIGPGTTITQMDYAKAKPEEQKLLLIKQEAFNSFRSGLRRMSYPSAYAYTEFTNVANLMDIRVDLGNARLTAGNLIKSDRTAQGAYGSSVRLGLNRNVVEGLDVGLTLGVAGGEKQIPENWDSRNLDYNPGKFAELGLKVDAAYTYEMKQPKLAVTAGMDFLMPDLLVETGNIAGSVRVGAHYNDFNEYIDASGFYLVDPKTLAHEIEASDVFEFTFGLGQDRYDYFDNKSTFAFGLRNELFFAGFGAELKLDAAYKSANFESKWAHPSTKERPIIDGFAGKSASGDFKTANAYDAALIDLDVAYDSFRLLNTRLFRVNAGFDMLVYGGKMAGLGFEAGLQFNLVDYVKQDLIIKGGMKYYRNSYVASFDARDKAYNDMFMSNATFTAGLEYAPASSFRTDINFVSAPSSSSRDVTRLTSVEARFKVSY